MALCSIPSSQLSISIRSVSPKGPSWVTLDPLSLPIPISQCHNISIKYLLSINITHTLGSSPHSQNLHWGCFQVR